jgi:uncharacterized protein (DUF58 family)
MNATPLLDRAFLEKLERLTIHWRKSFSGLVGGRNLSRFAGSGQDFLDHRTFHHGDDLRAVNWRAYIRLEKLFLKMFQLEPRVPVRMLVDSSASMLTHGGGKFEYARKLGGALCYVGLVRLDTFEIHGFSDHLGRRIVSSGGRSRFPAVMEGLTAMTPGGRTDFIGVVREFIGQYSQRGLVIVVSDFLDDNRCERGLQYLADFGHELMLLHVWADEDRVPPWTGELDLEDAETGAALRLEFDETARERYMRAFDEYCGTLQTLALRSGGRYAGTPASVPLESLIFGELARVRGVA